MLDEFHDVWVDGVFCLTCKTGLGESAGLCFFSEETGADA